MIYFIHKVISNEYIRMRRLSRDSNPRRTPKRARPPENGWSKRFAVFILKILVPPVGIEPTFKS
jgi:hypothetical protein